MMRTLFASTFFFLLIHGTIADQRLHAQSLVGILLQACHACSKGQTSTFLLLVVAPQRLPFFNAHCFHLKVLVFAPRIACLAV
jgi:hypothetical protein